MPRCCVSGCKSGSIGDLRRHREAGLRQKTQFIVPKDPILLRKWSELLKRNLRDTDRVCELHFKETDLDRYDQVHLLDGSIHKTVRNSCRLRYGALPIAIRFNNDLGSSSESDKTMNDSSVCSSSENNDTSYTNDISRDIMSYTFKQLTKDIESNVLIMPPNWAYILKENSNVTFASTDAKKNIIHLFCVIYENMDVQIVTGDRRIAVDVDLRFNSSKEILDYLQNLNKLYSCEGVGFDNRYSEYCEGFILPTDLDDDNELHRCPSCQNFRDRILMNHIYEDDHDHTQSIREEVDHDNMVTRYKIKPSRCNNINEENETVFVYY